jgi:hypothetical protein
VQDFTGINEKLIRAKENIFNLDSEIGRFFEESDYPILPENDRELILKAIEYHENRPIPPRFSVLAGEIVHHLRSCFDHVVWHFSVQTVKNIRKIEFPVFDKPPANHDGRKLFEGKIAGITNPDVLCLIEGLQPYNAADPIDDPLFIVNDFDITDKHKELVVCAGTGSMVFPPHMQSVIESYERAHPEADSAKIARHFKQYGIVKPYISFRNFGRREIQPIIPGLVELFNYAFNTVKRFEAL